ncbi:hypothetical protein D3C71_1659420 [compost metagenome]
MIPRTNHQFPFASDNPQRKSGCTRIDELGGHECVLSQLTGNKYVIRRIRGHSLTGLKDVHFRELSI